MPVSSRKTSISLKTKRSVSFNEKKDNLVQLTTTDRAKKDLHQDEAPDELSPLDINPQCKRKTYTLIKQNVSKTDLLSKKCRESNSTYVLNHLTEENNAKSINQPTMSTLCEVEPTFICDKINKDKPLRTEKNSPLDTTSKNNRNVVPFNAIEDGKVIEDDKVVAEDKIDKDSKVFIEQNENDVENGQVSPTGIDKVTVRKSARKRKPINYNNETKVDCQEPLTKRKRGRPCKSIKKLEEKAFENIDENVSNNEFSKPSNKQTNKIVMKKTIIDEKPSGNIDENVSNKESSKAPRKKASKTVIKETIVEETPSENIAKNVSNKRYSKSPSKKSSKAVIKETTVEETTSENIDENVSSKKSSKATSKKSSKTIMKKTIVEGNPFENIDENVSNKESSKAPSKKASKTVKKKTILEENPSEYESNKESSEAPSTKPSKTVLKKTDVNPVYKNQKQTIEENNPCLRNDQGIEDKEHGVKHEEESTSKSKKKVLKEDAPKKAPTQSKKHCNTEQIKSDEILSKFCTVL